MTNYWRIITLAFATTLTISGCKKHATPDEVALAFMHAIQHSNFEQARDYATKESQQVIQLYSFFDARRNDSVREKIKNAKIEVINSEENGDKAFVTIHNSSANQQEVLQLVKESGQWKISLTLESIIPNAIPPAATGGSFDSSSMARPDTQVSPPPAAAPAQ